MQGPLCGFTSAHQLGRGWNLPAGLCVLEKMGDTAPYFQTYLMFLFTTCPRCSPVHSQCEVAVCPVWSPLDTGVLVWIPRPRQGFGLIQERGLRGGVGELSERGWQAHLTVDRLGHTLLFFVSQRAPTGCCLGA